MSRGLARLREAIAPRRLKGAGLGVGVAYALIYLYALGHIAITPGRAADPTGSVFRVVGLENLWRERAPYNYEPVAVFQPWEGFAIFLAVPNLVIAAILGTLVALNVVLFVHTYVHYRQCGLKSTYGLVASLPAFLSGFACCAPSFALIVGAISASAFVPFIEVVMPVAIVALLLSLGWNLLRPLSGMGASAQARVEDSETH